jgi:sigma-E factor negative regulatory protein RseB
MLTPQGQVLEQLQLTSFQLSDELPVSLEDLQGVQRPPRLFDPNSAEVPQFSLLPRWLPSGFSLQRQTHRLLYATQLANDHFLYSDGLTEVSVYISRKRDQALPELAFEGAESFYNTSKGDYAITVVGKLPLATLRKIAENVNASEPLQ